MTTMQAQLAQVPDATVDRTASISSAIDETVAYLASDAALESLAIDSYWPKWNSPWWHMRLLHELGEASRIPTRVVTAMIAAVDALPLKIFPITKEEYGSADPRRDVTCHCALGTLWQVLTACGVDMDRALPWVRPWFPRYQMADGGMTCDDVSYTLTDECPSSMVGTIAGFEAMLEADPHGAFVERAAQFLIGRKLTLGSPTRHNAEERVSAERWPLLCSPRFYYHDVLRGLTALVQWAEHTQRTLPASAIEGVVTHLVRAFPDGVVRVGRDAVAGTTSWWITPENTLERRPAARSTLQDALSVIGAPSAALTDEWSGTRQALLRLLDAGRVTP